MYREKFVVKHKRNTLEKYNKQLLKVMDNVRQNC